MQRQKNLSFFIFSGQKDVPTAQRKNFLSELKKKYPSLQIKDYDVSVPASVELLKTMSKAYKINPTGVPVTFIGSKALIGFSEKTASQIEEAVNYCLKKYLRRSSL